LKAIVLFFVGVAVGIVVYHYAMLPRTIDRRAGDLGMMRYSHAAGGMVPTDDMRWTLHYLKCGTMQ
jgi:hypothetical protein